MYFFLSLIPTRPYLYTDAVNHLLGYLFVLLTFAYRLYCVESLFQKSITAILNVCINRLINVLFVDFAQGIKKKRLIITHYNVPLFLCSFKTCKAHNKWYKNVLFRCLHFTSLHMISWFSGWNRKTFENKLNMFEKLTNCLFKGNW